MEIKILGVCGSPVKNGNTEVFLGEALKAAEAIEGVTTKTVLLSGKVINALQCWPRWPGNDNLIDIFEIRI